MQRYRLVTELGPSSCTGILPQSPLNKIKAAGLAHSLVQSTRSGRDDPSNLDRAKDRIGLPSYCLNHALERLAPNQT